MASQAQPIPSQSTDACTHNCPHAATLQVQDQKLFALQVQVLREKALFAGMEAQRDHLGESLETTRVLMKAYNDEKERTYRGVLELSKAVTRLGDLMLAYISQELPGDTYEDGVKHMLGILGESKTMVDEWSTKELEEQERAQGRLIEIVRDFALRTGCNVLTCGEFLLHRRKELSLNTPLPFQRQITLISCLYTILENI